MSTDYLSTLPYDTVIQMPAATPPQGVVPNFDHPDAKNVKAITVITVCAVLATILAMVRAYAKAVCDRKVFVEDCK